MVFQFARGAAGRQLAGSPGYGSTGLARHYRGHLRFSMGDWRSSPVVAVSLAAVVFLVAAFGIALFFAGGARAQTPAPFKAPGEARTGTLLLKAEVEGRFIEAPRLGTDFDVIISGPTARGRLTQHFTNPTEGWVEAVYVFPLSEDAAVDTLKMVIGERAVIGEIKERGEAKAIYERAKAEGRKAALVDQERPNLFMHSVANIGPGETVVVQLEWQQAVPFADDQFSLRLPLVVAPRYNPKPIVQTVDLRPDGSGWGQVVDPVPDRDRITSPVLDPRENPPINPVSLTVRLQAGFELGDVKSHHHDIDTEVISGNEQVVTLTDGAVPADRDFELTWSVKSGKIPGVGLFHESVDGEDYILAFVTPPVVDEAKDGETSNEKAGATSPEDTPREVVFVIDNSGSMGGTSIKQARASLIYGLERLRDVDRFNVIRFDNTFSQLFPRSVAATRGNRMRAKGFVASLEASGGTEMLAPMAAALRDFGSGVDGGRANELRQVVFLTDGAIGNEKQLLELVGAERGRSRVFMVGIGSAPNSYLMTRASEIGRGSFTHIGSAEQVETRMRDLFAKLESPVITNLSASLGEIEGDMTPDPLPDLYRGEPVVLAAKVARIDGTLKLEGMIGNQPWTVSLPLSAASAGKGISKVWARRKIRDGEVAMRLGRINREDGDAKILSLALTHSLVSRLTSLVAVESEISRPKDARLTRADLPLNLPAGWDFDKVFGARGERAGEMPLQDLDQRADGAGTVAPGDAAGGRALDGLNPAPVSPNMPRLQKSKFAGVAASNAPSNVGGIMSLHSSGAVLPQTATDAELRMMLGVLALLLSAAFAFGGWRARFVKRD